MRIGRWQGRYPAGARLLDVAVPIKRADRRLNVRLRTVAIPDPDVATLLAHLGLSLPKRSKVIENVVEKMTP